jgi:hypothetical protein
MGARWGHQQLLALTLGLGLGGALACLGSPPAGLAGSFGRWQSRARQCSFQRSPGGQPRRCQVVRLEQNLEGLLSVRFLADEAGPQGGMEQLLFAGVLDSGQRPMACQQDGRCAPRWPTRMVVATVAATSFDDRGLATTVPHTLLARGRCEARRSQVQCHAENDAGERWSATAKL